jgi:WD40 repeat protein
MAYVQLAPGPLPFGVSSLSFAPAGARMPTDTSSTAEGTLLAASWLGGLVAVYDTRAMPKCAGSFRPHGDAVNVVRWLPGAALGVDGLLLLTASDDKTICLWPLAAVGPNAQPLLRLAASDAVNCVTVSSDGDTLYAGCDDGSVNVYSVELARAHLAQGSHEPIAAVDRFLASSQDTINDIAVLNTHLYGDVLLTASEDKALRAWRTSPHQRAPQEPLGPTEEQMRAALAQGDGDAIGEDGEVPPDAMAILRAALGDSNRLMYALDAFDMPLNHITVVPFRNTAAAGTVNPIVIVASGARAFALTFDLATGQFYDDIAGSFDSHQDFVRAILPIAGRYEEEVQQRPGPNAAVAAATAPTPSPFFPRFITVADDKVAAEWDLEIGATIATATNTEGGADALPANATPLVRAFQAHADLVMAGAIAVRADNVPFMLATGSEDGTIRAWDFPLPA